MTDTIPETITDHHLAHIRHTSNERFLSVLNAAGSVLLTAYPQGEVETWPIQKAEAEALLAAPEPAFNLAPFLTAVCAAQFGEATDEERLDQLIEKATIVKGHSDRWLAFAAFANGLRARVQIQFENATSQNEIIEILMNGTTELEDYRRDAGF